jgi:AAHS family 4-hydroxybenzoate transporter-like MFS transporter
VRATGVGWALGVGRIGSIIGPSVGGILLSLKWNAGELFMTAALAALCAAIAAFMLGRTAVPQKTPQLRTVTQTRA